MNEQNSTTFALIGARRPGKDGLYDLLVSDGRIAALKRQGGLDIPSDLKRVEAGGLLLMASMIDAHVHLREPGYEYKEDIQSGLAAAAHGGFGAVMPMANTKPVNDNAPTTRLMLEQAAKHHPNGPRLYPVGALTVGLEGKELAPMGELKEAGVVALSNDGRPVNNSELFRRGMEYAATWGLKVIDHCEDADLARGWHMNEGISSSGLGVKGQPGVGEAMQVARDILLAEYLNIPVHLAHISCRQSVDLIRWGKERGVQVTAETCPHYLLLHDGNLAEYNTAFKVSPPLRSPEDVKAVRWAVQDGTIDILVTDHAPHAAHEKEVPLDQAPCGLIGLESALPLTYGLVRNGLISEERLEELWSANPAGIFKLPVNAFNPGDFADFILFDPNEEWVYSRENIHSKSTNSPWLDKPMQGRVKAHWLGGIKIV